MLKKHNIQISKNRCILKRLISCVKCVLTGAKGHDETATPSNPGVHRGLIDYTAEGSNEGTFRNSYSVQRDFRNNSECIIRLHV
jgi:hypothetical protein